MRILLVYPSHRDVDVPLIPRPTRVVTGIYPPLGLLYIASSLRKYGFPDVRVVDGQTLKNEDKEVVEIVKDYHPKYVGLSAYTLTLFKAVKMARAIKEIDPSIHITFGGPHIRVYPIETVSLPWVDSIVVDEGEISYPELLAALEEGKQPYSVKGVYFKNNGRIVTNEKRAPVGHLDSLPFPDRRLLDNDHYFLVTNKSSRSTTLISSRGCPFKCIFCCTPDKLYRQRGPENVVDEIEECVHMGVRIFNFMDDVFNLTKKRVVAISREILRRHLTIEWTCTGRVDVVDREMLEIARESGLTRISFGIESGSDEILKYLNKGFTLDEAAGAVRLCKDLGIAVYGYFLLGIPFETRSQVEKTFRLAFTLGLDAAQFSPLTPGPGTRLYEMALKQGGFNRDYFLDYALNPQGPPQIKCWETTFTQKEIENIVKSAYRMFYMRPGFFLGSLRGLTSPGEIWRHARAGISMFKFVFGY